MVNQELHSILGENWKTPVPNIWCWHNATNNRNLFMTLPPYELLDTRRVCFVAMNPMRPTRCRQHVFCCLIHPPDATKGCLVACMSSSHKGNTKLYFWAAILNPCRQPNTRSSLAVARHGWSSHHGSLAPWGLVAKMMQAAKHTDILFVIYQTCCLIWDIIHIITIYCKIVFIIFREFNYIQLWVTRYSLWSAPLQHWDPLCQT